MQTKFDSIAAIATAPGRGGIGVVRISGSDLEHIISAVLGFLPSPRKATFCDFLEADGSTIDQGLAIYFVAPHSYTGENILELQGHGGSAVLQLLLQRCLVLGARLARPGEFTERAFLNNKLDLAQAESVADLIDATTTQAAKSAMRSLTGEFSQSIHVLVEQLISLRMLTEAMIDFPEEEIDTSDFNLRNSKLNLIQDSLSLVLSKAQQGSLLREGAQIALIGQPNVGKSSLLNALSGEDVALVSDIAGTTRDVIRQSIQLNGIPLHIMDTAGLRDTTDVVERMGIERTRNSIQKADVILILLDSSHGLTASDNEILSSIPSSTPRLFIHNKIDLANELPHIRKIDNVAHIYLSAKTGVGLDLLKQELLTLIGWHQESGVFMARERHLQALESARNHLVQAKSVIDQSELFAEELKLSQHKLNEITGEFTSDDLLGEIFTRFCIGK